MPFATGPQPPAPSPTSAQRCRTAATFAVSRRPMTDDAFEQLARQRGVGDVIPRLPRSSREQISRESQAAIFAAMGVDAS